MTRHVRSRQRPPSRLYLGKLLMLAGPKNAATFHKHFDKYGKPAVRVQARRGASKGVM